MYLIATFYRFFELDDPHGFCAWAQKRGDELDLVGTILVAGEGINGTLSGDEESVRSFIGEMVAVLPVDVGLVDGAACRGGRIKESWAEQAPFDQFRVRVKDEIVKFCQAAAKPLEQTGTYLSPQEWNRLLEDENVVLVDTRNDYEIETGRFQGAIDPQTQNFTDFAKFVAHELPDIVADKKRPTIAMYCTGGIRCEKATSFVLAQEALAEQVADVVHLEGGILSYLEQIPPDQSKFVGECFVFDNRVTVDHALEPGHYDMCAMCGWPLDVQDRQHPDYQPGLWCSRCVGTHSQDRIERARERLHQRELARLRGESPSRSR